MYRGGSLLEVLRLLVLLNECHQGLSKKHLDPLRQELLHTYGHQHLLTLSNLEVAGAGVALQVALQHIHQIEQVVCLRCLLAVMIASHQHPRLGHLG